MTDFEKIAMDVRNQLDVTLAGLDRLLALRNSNDKLKRIALVSSLVAIEQSAVNARERLNGYKPNRCETCNVTHPIMRCKAKRYRRNALA